MYYERDKLCSKMYVRSCLVEVVCSKLYDQSCSFEVVSSKLIPRLRSERGWKFFCALSPIQISTSRFFSSSSLLFQIVPFTTTTTTTTACLVDYCTCLFQLKLIWRIRQYLILFYNFHWFDIQKRKAHFDMPLLQHSLTYI